VPLLSYLPAAHFVHARSTDVEPSKEMYSPGLHVVKLVHEPVFGVELKAPSSHEVHSRSDVTEGALDW
jgi:hypothetical protein